MATPVDPPKEPVTTQPKISQKLILRTAILLFALALLFFGYRYFEEQHGDFNRGSSNSAGVIAAIQIKDDGQEAVLIHPGGAITGTKTWKNGVTDRDITWQPDGRFLYFVSDRDGGTYHLLRLNPDEDTPDQMTTGSRGRSAPTFPADSTTDVANDLLMICGGTVQGFDAKRKITPQLLPPATANITQATEEGAGGSEAEFQALYGNLGTAFRYARYCKSNRYIAAIMEREGGEVLILQDLTQKDGKVVPPISVAAGDHIDFDVNPKDGSVVFAVLNYKLVDPEHAPKDLVHNGQLMLPFKHAVGVADPDKRAFVIVGASKDDRICFASPAISPDGASVLVTAGSFDKSTQTIVPKILFSAPIQNEGFQSGSRLISGEIYEPSWSPDGSKIVFAMRANGKRDIYTAAKDGSSPTNLTAGKGDFLTPKFSGQGSSGG